MNWQEQKFVAGTKFSSIKENGETVLRVDCRESASGLVREIEIDLTKTPWITWQWWIQETNPEADGHQRASDDMAARLYVVSGGRLLPWRAKALNYVWSNRYPKESSWTSPWLKQQRVVAVESGNHNAGQWVQIQRNIAEDFRAQFGAAVDEVNLIGVMSDCDNLRTTGAAKIGKIRFLSKPILNKR